MSRLQVLIGILILDCALVVWACDAYAKRATEARQKHKLRFHQAIWVGFADRFWRSPHHEALHNLFPEASPRFLMIGDIEANYLHAGMSRNEVESLLGPADQAYAWSPPMTMQKGAQWHYDLSPDPRFRGGSSDYVLTFDERGLLRTRLQRTAD